MPAKSKAQQMAAGAALSAKRGETPKSKLKGASKDMAQSMNEGELEELASTARKGLPRRKTAKKAVKRTTRKSVTRAAPKKSATRKTARKTTGKKRAAR